MKITLDSYSDYLILVRVLISNSHDLENLNQIIKTIDSSALNVNASIEDIAAEFSLADISEFKESSSKLLRLAIETSNDALITLIDSYYLFSCMLEEGREIRFLKFNLKHPTHNNHEISYSVE